MKGNVIPRDQIPDETFAFGVLGDGVGIDPAEGVAVAPFDGEISSITDTKRRGRYSYETGGYLGERSQKICQQD